MALNNEPRSGERDPALDRLYRAGAADEPPARLDAAILAAARREVNARPVPVASGLRRWRVPVSLAAMLVLSVSLVTLVREEGGDSLLQAPSEPAAPMSAPAQSVQPTPGASVENRTARSRAAELPASRADAGAGEPMGKTEGRAAERGLAGAPGPAVPGTAATGAVSEPAAKPSPQPFRDAPQVAEQSVPEIPSAGAGADQAARAPAAAERRAAPMMAPAPEVAGARIMAQARKESAAAEDRAPPVWQGYEKEPPQKWLDRIQELRRQQRVAEAEAMLAEFRRRFPGYPLPAGQP